MLEEGPLLEAAEDDANPIAAVIWKITSPTASAAKSRLQLRN